jgi:hypothetical protein
MICSGLHTFPQSDFAIAQQRVPIRTGKADANCLLIWQQMTGCLPNRVKNESLSKSAIKGADK